MESRHEERVVPVTLTVADIEARAVRALRGAGASDTAAHSVARAVAAAEADGVASHGLAYVPIYCEHIRCGKVDGNAVPVVEHPRPALLVVDAKAGFAHPAIDAGFERLLPLAREQGIAALAIRNSYNCGVLGYHTDRLARAGLIGFGFTHAPASIAPSGGRKPVFGTNPFAMAVPGADGSIAISIDQSASVVAKSEIMKAHREGRPIREGLAFGPDGKPTTDPETALKGSMAPAGGYKGVGIALMVELLASLASGAVLSMDASPFSGPAGGPPRTGQFFVAIDPTPTSDGRFQVQLERLLGAIAEQEGAHVPGTGRAAARRRAAAQGVVVSDEILRRIEAES
jgi:(2R)-3-sulfolactate dehydrogenase (NADP+)